jgi:hypothetical protein
VLDQVRTAPTTPAFTRRAAEALFELSLRIDAAEPLRFEVLTHRVGVKHPAYAPSERTWTPASRSSRRFKTPACW